MLEADLAVTRLVAKAWRAHLLKKLSKYNFSYNSFSIYYCSFEKSIRIVTILQF